MAGTIITFANQKGGVGKSTLCTLFANYLADKNESVMVIDCDPQQSIYKRRQYEQQNLNGFKPPYRVEVLGLEPVQNVERLMTNLRQLDTITLIDTPPGLGSQGQMQLIRGSDWIIVPFQYELSVAMSTNAFLGWINKEPTLGPMYWNRVILVPNRIQVGAGNAMEKEKIEQFRETLSQIVIFAPQIDQRKDIERTKTMMLSNVQHKLLDTAFEYIYNIINELRTDTDTEYE